jgi:hypothetical protein
MASLLAIAQRGKGTLPARERAGVEEVVNVAGEVAVGSSNLRPVLIKPILLRWFGTVLKGR